MKTTIYYKSLIAACICILFTTNLVANSKNFDSTPDLDLSQFIAISSVGDILGHEGKVGVSLFNYRGVPLSGITVKLVANGNKATLTNISGKTDKNGSFTSSLFSKVMTVVKVTAVIDIDGDGKAETSMDKTISISFINSIASHTGVGINTDTPDDSAVLHINSSDRGVLIPRVALLGCSDRVTILDPALSLLVFNTNPSDSLKVGYVYFNGTDWVNFYY
ncbi:hypothetical protein BST97_04430 [Nonlabens spongiae]|uniref:Big-1 domain-containing protein n=1 Tax=Nonlabens spongiae TaxID=331648 RepID=A0A1W6MI92_9FLAO|nr:hypothetical protein [Nonlabens spongiae]ARN77287.1 hypothetical protein BST97_04430 [Nonlabens spongiae]